MLDRDLARVDLWDESQRRSRERRERAAAQPPFELPARGLSVTALIALAGVPVTAVAIGKTLTGGGDQPTAVAQAASKRVSVEQAVGQAVDRASGIDKPAAAKPAPAAKATASAAGSKTASTTSTTTATKQRGQTPEIAAPAKPESTTATVKAAAVESKPVARAARSGGGVAALQRKLGVTADGDFGPGTERALKRWQRRHGLTADGVAGPQTRAALGLGPGKALKRKHAARKRHAGQRRQSAHRASNGGGGVRGLQAALGIGVDGVFGPATEQALKRWQRSHGLAADGVAGPQTRQALGLGPGKVLKRKGSGGGSSGGGGGSSSTLQGVIAAANRIASYPYKYGGGHGSFTDSGYDCSGSVSYALHGGGLLSSPIDSGAFMSYGAPGPGKHITIYANPGHVYMTIDGRRYDTSARSETGSRWTSTPRSTAGYTVRHPRGF